MDDDLEGYEYLGRYAIHEVKRLLDALEEAKIGFDATFDDGSGNMGLYSSYGTASGVEIMVETARRHDVDRIHTDVFGSALPDLSDSKGKAWSDDNTIAELNQLVAREAIGKELAEIDTDLQAIITEMTSVKATLEAGSRAPDQIATLEASQESNRRAATALLDRQRTLKASLAELDSTSNTTN